MSTAAEPVLPVAPLAGRYLPPGEYVFSCDVPGHRDAGMEAELQVE